MKSTVFFSIVLFSVICFHTNIAGASDIVFDDEISRISYHANQTDKAITNSHQIYNNAQTTQYLQSIINKLYPDYADVFRIHIRTSTETNAFVLPNGSVYVNLGMLAAANNEAQIATILAHEGAHYVLSHPLQKRQNLKDVISDIEFFGFERSLGYLSEYSIELETEADTYGFNRMVKAGYAAKEAANIFRTIADEIELNSSKEHSPYGTHPRIVTRIKYFERLSASSGQSGYVGEEVYLRTTQVPNMDFYQLALSKYQYENVLFKLQTQNRIAGAPAIAWYYLAEAYRQRDEPGDTIRAENAYLRAIADNPELAPAYVSLGVLYMKLAQPQKALRQFQKYFFLPKDLQTNAYVLRYYKHLKGKLRP